MTRCPTKSSRQIGHAESLFHRRSSAALPTADRSLRRTIAGPCPLARQQGTQGASLSLATLSGAARRAPSPVGPVNHDRGGARALVCSHTLGVRHGVRKRVRRLDNNDGDSAGGGAACGLDGKRTAAALHEDDLHAHTTPRRQWQARISRHKRQGGRAGCGRAPCPSTISYCAAPRGL